jgi:hypothetical protein
VAPSTNILWGMWSYHESTSYPHSLPPYIGNVGKRITDVESGFGFEMCISTGSGTEVRMTADIANGVKPDLF